MKNFGSKAYRKSMKFKDETFLRIYTSLGIQFGSYDSMVSDFHIKVSRTEVNGEQVVEIN